MSDSHASKKDVPRDATGGKMIESKAPFGRKIPPLNPLRAFAVAARHLSFTQAAEELCVTQGAISRSVKALEDYLGEPLFERTGHGLVLTEQSEAFALRLSDGFARLAEATDEFFGIQANPVLTIRTYTSFLIGFLIPNLPDFQIRHPDIKVRLLPAMDNVEIGRDLTDVRIRYGRGAWKGTNSTLLFHDCLRPVCSPALLDPAKRPYNVETLASQVMLHQELRRPDWPDWLNLVGAGDLVPRDNLVFDELSIVYQAAIAGVGLVMAQKAYFQREIAEGRLFEPFAATLTRDRGYYLTTPSSRREPQHVRQFRIWLLEAIDRAGLDRNLSIRPVVVSLPQVPDARSASVPAAQRERMVA
jgi:LysR family transcriptional regulator, glycine cleavage system transcriptional activator